jgi:hypothetical protein
MPIENVGGEGPEFVQISRTQFETLKTRAAAYREREWVPVETRLPENGHTKEITYEGPHGLDTEFGRYANDQWCWSNGQPSKVKVIAWRERPTPFTGRGGNL